jgi:microcystin-dependent protein
MFWGQGPGLSLYDLGQQAGSSTVTLLESEMPSHSHAEMAAAQLATSAVPSASVAPARSRGMNLYQSNVTQNLVQMAPQTIGPAGGGLPHNNMMPFLTFYFCIALQGVFPPRG